MHTHPPHDNVLPFRLAPAARQPLLFYPAGAEIYGQGEPSGPVYQVESGAVRVYRLLPDGRRQITAFHLPGEAFGFECHQAHHFFAEAIVPTGLRAFCQSGCASLAAELLPLALQSLTRAQEHLLVLGRQCAIERMAVFLADMAERQGGSGQIELPMPRADIGDYLGMTIETASRVLTKLKAKGIIKLTGMRSVRVCNSGALRGVSECQFAA